MTIIVGGMLSPQLLVTGGLAAVAVVPTIQPDPYRAIDATVRPDPYRAIDPTGLGS